MTSPYPFPTLIDNSAISSFKKCPTDWLYGSLRSITRKGGNIHLHFGGAYAAGLEAGRKAFYDEGIDEETFVQLRTSRDKTLAAPQLIWPSLQVNLRAGHLPPAESNGRIYLKTPLNAI